MREYYVYMIVCEGDRLYTGITVDVKKRFSSHSTGKGGAKFTRGFRPLALKALWFVSGGRGVAQRIEAVIKSLPRKEKDILAANPSMLKEIVIGRGIESEVQVCDVREYEFSHCL